MRLAVENPKLTEDFKEIAEAAGLPLPWELRPDGCLYAANGACACVTDPDGALSDIEALRGALLIQLAVNTCGGFKATPAEAA